MAHFFAVFYRSVRSSSHLEAILARFRFLSCTYHEKGKCLLPQYRGGLHIITQMYGNTCNTIRET